MSVIQDSEYLYRGVLEISWDFENGRPTSAIFKDSKGVSTDRSLERPSDECVNLLKEKRNFYRVCSIKVCDVRSVGALVLHKPEADNIYHSEIHGSSSSVKIAASKAKQLRDLIFAVYE